MNRNGFTLIEVLIVVVILALVALGIMALFPAGFSQVTKAGRVSIMNHLGYEKIDELKGLSYSNSDLTQGTHPSNKPDYRLDTTEYPDYDGYSVVWYVKDDEPRDDVKRVIVEVGYMLYDTSGNDIDFSDQQFQIEEKFITYIAQ